MSAPVTEVFITSGDVPHYTIEQVKLDQKEIQKLDAARHLISDQAYEDAVKKLRSESEQMEPEEANFDLLKRVVARYKVLDPAVKNTASAREALVVLLLNRKPEPLTADDNEKDGTPKYTSATEKLVMQVREINGGAWSTIRGWCNEMGPNGKRVKDKFLAPKEVLEVLDQKVKEATEESKRKAAVAEENKAKKAAAAK